MQVQFVTNKDSKYCLRLIELARGDLKLSKTIKLLDPYESVLCRYGISYRLTRPVLTVPLVIYLTKTSAYVTL